MATLIKRKMGVMQILRNAPISGMEWLVRRLDRLAASRSHGTATAPHLLTGERGEEAAYFYLRRAGFTVVAQRWNDGPLPGDLDLIAWQDDILCFIEVKTRTSKEVATASSAVDHEKRKILRRLARQYLRHLPESMELPETRFDIISVYELPGRPREIQLIPAAFGWSERG